MDGDLEPNVGWMCAYVYETTQFLSKGISRRMEKCRLREEFFLIEMLGVSWLFNK